LTHIKAGTRVRGHDDPDKGAFSLLARLCFLAPHLFGFGDTFAPWGLLPTASCFDPAF